MLPLSVVLKSPSGVLAYRVEGSAGSMARTPTVAPSGPKGVHAFTPASFERVPACHTSADRSTAMPTLFLPLACIGFICVSPGFTVFRCPRVIGTESLSRALPLARGG